jgi:hypothetical protein
MDDILNRYESVTDAIIDLFDWITNKISALSMLILGGAHFAFVKIYDFYGLFARSIYGPFRWSTIPLNYLIVRSFLWYIFRDAEIEPLDKEGLHYVRGNPGGGKSMLAFQKSNEIVERTGYASYHTSRIEKPRLSEDGKFYVVSHRVINPRNYYKDRKKLMRYNTQRYKSFFVDEFHVANNSRLNKEKKYNDFFVPFLNDLILMRHEGFENNIYIFSQVPTNDIQIMSVLAMYHEVEIKKGLRYIDWLVRGRFEISPLYFKITSYTIDKTSSDFRKKIYRKWRKRIDVEKLKYFDTIAMKNEFDDLPLDYK